MLLTLLVSTVLAAGAGDAPDLQPVARKQQRAERDGTPAGCLSRFICYRPPTDSELHPDLKDRKWRIYLMTLFLGPVYGGLWQIPQDRRPVVDDGTLRALFILQFGSAAAFFVWYWASLFFFYTYYLWVFGVLSYALLALAVLVFAAYIQPVVTMHIYNSMMKEQTPRSRARAEEADEADEEDDDDPEL